MTSVTILRKDHKILGYQVEGHSGYGESGTDVVCSAISILAYTGINTLVYKYKYSVEFVINDGLISLELSDKVLDNSIEAQVVLQTIITGFESVQESYSKYITLKNREV